jgi:hypothetical protein
MCRLDAALGEPHCWPNGSRQRAELADGEEAKASLMVFARIGKPTNGDVNMAWESDRTDQTPGIEKMLDDLYASEISASISLVTPGRGFYAELGDPIQVEAWGYANAREAVEWLREQAIRLYPASEFAQRYGRGFT